MTTNSDYLSGYYLSSKDVVISGHSDLLTVRYPNVTLKWDLDLLNPSPSPRHRTLDRFLTLELLLFP